MMLGRGGLLCSLLFTACANAPRAERQAPIAAAAPPPPPPPTAAPAPVAEPAPALAPLAEPPMILLTTAQSRAFVVPPNGACEPRPILVGAHGAGDRADWSCTEWAATVGAYAWIVCPEGVGSKWAGYQAWGSAAQIAERADAAVAAVRAAYGPYVAEGPMVFGGWSQAGTLTSAVVASRKGLYSSAIMVEVGHTPLDAGAVVRELRAAGVTRAVVSCSSGPCRDFTTRFAAASRRQGLPFRTNDVGLRGHWFDEPVFRSLGPVLAWTVEEDPRWDGLGASIEARWPEALSAKAP